MFEPGTSPSPYDHREHTDLEVCADLLYVFVQIRKAGEAIRMEHLLYNGWPAGRFALSILQGNHNKRRERKALKDGEGDAEGEDDEDTPVVADVEAPVATN